MPKSKPDASSSKKAPLDKAVDKVLGKVGRVTTESVLKCTGKNWASWVQILERAGARGLTHKEIVAFLKTKHRLGLWWQQVIASGFETVIGRKIEGRNEKGEYSVAGSRTFAIEKKAAWKLLSSKDGIAIWLKPLSDFHLEPGATFESEGGVFGEVRTMKPGDRIRMTWQESDWEKPTTVQIILVARKNKKCIIGFQHEKIKDARLKSRLRDHWKNVLMELREFIQPE
jgi:uncharacterized protein YndB with AHSA1/START domain